MNNAIADIVAAASPGATGIAPPTQVQLGWGASLTDFADLGRFEQAMAGAARRIQATPATPPSEGARLLLQPFEHINAEAAQLSSDARATSDLGRELTPGELVSLTVRCQEFMFHCQLTSNIANRTSDGLQQLFRQQS
jgi:hypothetical protein